MNLSGSPVDYLIAFVGGIAASLTPCVYPLIPVSVGYIGANSSGSKRKGFILSLFYVTGVAVTYSFLGLLASLTGTIFGKISSSPLTYIIVGIVIVLFSISMLEWINIPIFNLIKLPAVKKGNYLSVFVLGLTSGLIASPCLTPVLGSILAYLAAKKNLLYGATLLFVFAYGMGIILIIAGTFSAFLVSLPKAGKWTVIIKKVFALILIILGLYFVFNGIRRL